MQRIITGRFETKGGADTAAVLFAQYIDSSDICIFHNNPPDQNGSHAFGGDEAADPGAEGAADTEKSDGEWLDGDWVDFDPVVAPRLVKKPPSHSGDRRSAVRKPGIAQSAETVLRRKQVPLKK